MHSSATRRLLALLALASLAIAPASGGESRTLVAKDGRSIEVEILSYQKEVLRIRRADTNKEYDLPLSSLDPAEQDRMRAFIKAHPELRETIAADSLRVEFSRKRKTSPKMEGIGRSTRISQASFYVSVTNRSKETAGNLRVDYVIFVEQDPDGRSSRKESAPMKQVTGSKNLEPIASMDNASLVTAEVTIEETTLYKSWTTVEGGQTYNYTRSAKEAGTWKNQDVYGIRIQIYDGDRLVKQVDSPESLALVK